MLCRIPHSLILGTFVACTALSACADDTISIESTVSITDTWPGDETHDSEPTGGQSCFVVPLYIAAHNLGQRPWVRALHNDCTPAELQDTIASHLLLNLDTATASPGGLVPAFLPDDSAYPDTLTSDCVVWLYGMQWSADKWQLQYAGTSIVSTPDVPQYVPGSLWAVSRNTPWAPWTAHANAGPGSLPRCTPGPLD